MDLPKGNFGMLIAAILGGFSCSMLILIFLLLYLKRKKQIDGYRRLEHELFISEARRQSRAKSCFDLLYTPQQNGKAPPFSIPVTRPKTQPKRTCQVQFSLHYNFHTSVLKIQVICAVNLPRLFGLQSGVYVKVHLLSPDDEVRQDLGKTATQFRSKNPVFKDFFETKETPYEELKEMTVNFSLYSFDRFSHGHFVGNASVKFTDINLSPLEPIMFWRPVQPKVSKSPKCNREKGHLVFSLRYQQKTSRINVVVMKAINLATPKRLSRTDPYVVVKLLFNDEVVERKRTQPCKGNLNPVWNEPFVFDWKNGQPSGYKFVFEIRSSDKVVPDACLGKVEVCQDTSDHWKEMMARKNYARAMCHEVQ